MWRGPSEGEIFSVVVVLRERERENKEQLQTNHFHNTQEVENDVITREKLNDISCEKESCSAAMLDCGKSS